MTICVDFVNVASAVHSRRHKSQVHLQFCVEVTVRIEGKDCCPMTVAPVLVLHVKDANVHHAAYARWPSERALFHM